MHLKLFIPTFIIALMTVIAVSSANPTFEVVSRSDVEFQPLNPLRGDASPKAGVLWGDIKKDVPTGTLIKFAEGFSSPPHIHNITYRGVVISGAVHNDDPTADDLWMGSGSFWTQPAGETHITAAKGQSTIAFLEILEGPYLVRPSKEAFDNGERPINVEARNVVWLDSSNVTWIDHPAASSSANGLKMAFLWGNPEDGQKNGTFLKVSTDLKIDMRSNGSRLRAVLIQGKVSHQRLGVSDAEVLEPGSYLGSTGDVTHTIVCQSDSECLFYVSADGKYEVLAR